MALTDRRLSPIARARSGRVAVIDIGSNSIRIVVYDQLSRAPRPIFNEKILCGLGRDLARTGSLHPEGRVMALKNLARFRRLVDAMGVRHVDVIATAAVREAEDGKAFAAEVKRRCGLGVATISGAEEARLSAMGVLSGTPGADGVMGDLGGGSLELVALDREAIGRQVTLPLGPFRLMAGGQDLTEIQTLVDTSFAEEGWLSQYRGRTFYPVGGAWRSLAKVHMAQTGYPVHVIHHYAVPGTELLALAGLIARQHAASLDRLPAVNKRRLETLPYAALVLESLLKAFAPSEIVFSAYGLREGHLFDQLPEKQRAADPLLHTCSDIARQLRRFGEAAGIARWTGALFVGETPVAARLREAACLLSDFCWAEHPDYRAEHAYLRTLRMAVVGLNHAERVFLASTLYARYGEVAGDRISEAANWVLTADEIARANLLGTTLRLAHTLTGGATGLLESTRLERAGDELILWLSANQEALDGDVVARRLDSVARILGVTPRIAVEPAGNASN